MNGWIDRWMDGYIDRESERDRCCCFLFHVHMGICLDPVFQPSSHDMVLFVIISWVTFQIGFNLCSSHYMHIVPQNFLDVATSWPNFFGFGPLFLVLHQNKLTGNACANPWQVFLDGTRWLHVGRQKSSRITTPLVDISLPHVIVVGAMIPTSNRVVISS